MVFISLLKGELIILVTNPPMCYKHVSFHFLYDIFRCAEDFNFNVVTVVNLFLYGLLYVYMCLIQKVPFLLQVCKDIFLYSLLKINFAFYV